MPSAEVMAGVVDTNFKVIAEQPAVHTNNAAHSFAQTAAMATQNAVAGQARLNGMLDAAAGALVKRISELDAAEAESITTVRSGNELAEMQIASKLAQTVRPETGSTG